MNALIVLKHKFYCRQFRSIKCVLSYSMLTGIFQERPINFKEAIKRKVNMSLALIKTSGPARWETTSRVIFITRICGRTIYVKRWNVHWCIRCWKTRSRCKQESKWAYFYHRHAYRNNFCGRRRTNDINLHRAFCWKHS